MSSHARVWGPALALLVASCATSDPVQVTGRSSVEADLAGADGRARARASVSEESGSLSVRIEAQGLPPGAYGAHIHSAGRCDPPDFASAGPHWNPAARQHGRENPQGMHKGDLPNLMVGTDGRGSFQYRVEGASLRGNSGPALLDSDGAAVVIHSAADDYRTDPSGNSGARIACGVLG